ncbi:hypothetical protein NPS70_09440 [Streptomyces sp. C10-9-1]|uniref:hypothetical protein n=1 Tax=Streptomyces sp. C10-9-1 TaxID=1859285 RepID=UPI0021110588|nr:hypothetical protein [Streptomyces sp. C10-9-1]MCQ6553416.1 hypothetical protein [Streptomyces sp. C10-9-1]
MACFMYFVSDPIATTVLGGLSALSFSVGFALRRREKHSVRCSAYGSPGGVLDTSMAGF